VKNETVISGVEEAKANPQTMIYPQDTAYPQARAYPQAQDVSPDYIPRATAKAKAYLQAGKKIQMSRFKIPNKQIDQKFRMGRLTQKFRMSTLTKKFRMSRLTENSE